MYVAFLLLLLVGEAPAVKNYTGSQVWRLFPESKVQRDAINKLRGQLDFWSDGTMKDQPVDIRSDHQTNGTLFKVINAQRIKHELHIANIGKLIESETNSGWKTRSSDNEGMNWKGFHSYETIHQWLQEVSNRYKNISKVIDIGKSTEGRTLKVIKIGIGGGKKRGYWIDGGFHAREWASPATVTWIINELLVHSKAYTKLLTNLDFYILPMLNPDGYEYSRKEDRMWRKTRSKTKHPICIGVDPNRNWDAGFGGPGTTKDPCDETYSGERPFSIPETEAMRKFIVDSNKTVNWKMYNSIHAYSQVIISPWGYKLELASDSAEMVRLGKEAAAAIKKIHGTVYEAGPTSTIFDLGAGGSDDWAKLSGIFKYSYTFEVRDKGAHGFHLPAKDIVHTAEENWAGILVMANFAQKL